MAIAHSLCAFAVKELSRLNTLPSGASGEAMGEAASHEATLPDGQAEMTDMPNMEVSCCSQLSRSSPGAFIGKL